MPTVQHVVDALDGGIQVALLRLQLCDQGIGGFGLSRGALLDLSSLCLRGSDLVTQIGILGLVAQIWVWISPVMGSLNWVKLLAKAAKPEPADPRNLKASEIWVSESALNVLVLKLICPVSLNVTPRSDRLRTVLLLLGL